MAEGILSSEQSKIAARSIDSDAGVVRVLGRVGSSVEKVDLAVVVHGFVVADDRQVKAAYLDDELHMFVMGASSPRTIVCS